MIEACRRISERGGDDNIGALARVPTTKCWEQDCVEVEGGSKIETVLYSLCLVGRVGSTVLLDAHQDGESTVLCIFVRVASVGAWRKHSSAYSAYMFNVIHMLVLLLVKKTSFCRTGTLSSHAPESNS